MVSMPPEGLEWFMATCDAFIPSLAAHLEPRGYTPQPLTKMTEEPEQTVQLVANMALVAYSDSEATLDFYHSSAWAFHLLQQGAGNLAVDPVVRIDLDATLLKSLLDKLVEVRKSLKTRRP